MIVEARRLGQFKGIKRVDYVIITHLLFVDDVVRFGTGSIEEWSQLSDIIKLFCSASGMELSFNKSSFMFHNMEENVLHHISIIFPYGMSPIENGFKYLGFYIKPNLYRISDWYWLVNRYEKRIGHWVFKYLSLGGRITLLKVVLTSMLVYWFSLGYGS